MFKSVRTMSLGSFQQKQFIQLIVQVQRGSQIKKGNLSFITMWEIVPKFKFK